MIATGTALAVAVAGCVTSGPSVAVGGVEDALIDDFNATVLDTQVFANTDEYSEGAGDGLIRGAEAEVELAPGQGPDGSAAVRFDFAASFSSLELGRWKHAYLAHNTWLETPRGLGRFNAVALDLKPLGFSIAKTFVGQEHPDGSWHTIFTYLHLVNDEWQRVLLPFDLMERSHEFPGLADDLPITVQLSVPVVDNFHVFHYRDGIERGELEMAGSVLVDNLRFVTAPAPEHQVFADFEHPDAPLLHSAELRPTGMYYDYSNDDSGEERITPGLTDLFVRTEVKDDGPEGSFLRFSGAYAIDDDIREYLDTGNVFYATLNMSGLGSWEGGNELTFLIRSSSFDHTTIVYDDRQNERSFYTHGVGVSDLWTRIRIPFSRFDHDGATLGARRSMDRRASAPIQVRGEERGGRGRHRRGRV